MFDASNADNLSNQIEKLSVVRRWWLGFFTVMLSAMIKRLYQSLKVTGCWFVSPYAEPSNMNLC